MQDWRRLTENEPAGITHVRALLEHPHDGKRAPDVGADLCVCPRRAGTQAPPLRHATSVSEKCRPQPSPGRYGAVVRIVPGNGAPVERRLTLFRQPAALDWSKWQWPAFRLDLPPELGVNPVVLQRWGDKLAEYLKKRLAKSASEDEESAVLLAGLHETLPEDPVSHRLSPLERDRRWWFGLKQKLGRVNTPYLLYLPPGYDEDPTKRWPLLLFLHGTYERGSNLEQVKARALPMLIAQGRQFPFVIVSPLCPADEYWLPVELNALLDKLEAECRVDPDRVYCTGLSMGAYATWETAIEFPARFAALAPVCGAGDLQEVQRIKHIPVWVFHGAHDELVPVDRAWEMVDALRKAGAKPLFTVYPDADHDAWTRTYASRRLYDWLSAQRRGRSAR